MLWCTLPLTVKMLAARRLAASLAPRPVQGVMVSLLPALPSILAPSTRFSTAAEPSIAAPSSGSNQRSKFFRAEEHIQVVEEEELKIPQRTRHFTLRDAVFPTKDNGYKSVTAYRYAHVHHEILAMLDTTGPLTRHEIVTRMVETGYSRTFVKNSVRKLSAQKRIRYRVLLHPRTRQPSFFFYTTAQSKDAHAKEIQKESYLRRYLPAPILEKVAGERAYVEQVITAAKERAQERARLLQEMIAAREAEAQALRLQNK